jgi:hypothetical protein
MNELTTIERNELHRLEKLIDRGQKTFVEVGNALLRIRDDKLYRESSETFTDYCTQVWGFSKQRASQLIEAAKIEKECQPVVDVPNERVARAIKDVPADSRQEVVEVATGKAKGKPLTTASIRKAVSEVLEGKPEESANDDRSMEEKEADTRQQTKSPHNDLWTAIEEEAEEISRDLGNHSRVADFIECISEALSKGSVVAVARLENLAVKLRK